MYNFNCLSLHSISSDKVHRWNGDDNRSPDSLSRYRFFFIFLLLLFLLPRYVFCLHFIFSRILFWFFILFFANYVKSTILPWYGWDEWYNESALQTDVKTGKKKKQAERTVEIVVVGGKKKWMTTTTTTTKKQKKQSRRKKKRTKCCAMVLFTIRLPNTVD